MMHHPSANTREKYHRAYFEAISLLPKHVGAVLINGRCIGYILAENNWKKAFYWINLYLSLNFKATVIA